MSNLHRAIRFALPLSLILWLLLTLAMLACCGRAHAGDFSTETVVEESVYQALHVIDSAQTVYIARDPSQYYERVSGWAIGHHPSEADVVRFMAADAIVHILVTTALVRMDAPSWATRTWELLTISSTGYCVRSNIKIGIKARF
jgi:hypothetical protein